MEKVSIKLTETKLNLIGILLVIFVVSILIPIGVISTIVVSWIALYSTKKLKLTGYKRLWTFFLIVYCITLSARLPGMISDLVYVTTKQVNKIYKITKINMNQKVFLSTNSTSLHGMRFLINYFSTKKLGYDFFVTGDVGIFNPSYFSENYLDELKEKPILFTNNNRNTDISIKINTKSTNTHYYIDIKILENKVVNARYIKRFRKTFFLGQYDNFLPVMFTVLFEDNIYNFALKLIKPTSDLNKNQYTPIINFINSAIDIVPSRLAKSIELNSKIIKIDSNETFQSKDIIDKLPWLSKKCKNKIRFSGVYENTINAKEEDVFISIRQRGDKKNYISIAPVYKKELLIRPSIFGLYCNDNEITVITRAYNYIYKIIQRLPIQIRIMKVTWEGKIISDYNSEIHGFEDVEKKSYMSEYFIKSFKEDKRKYSLVVSNRIPMSKQEKKERPKMIKIGKQYFVEIIK